VRSREKRPLIASHSSTVASSTSTSPHSSRALAALIAAIVLIPPGATGSVPADDERTAIQALLDRRADAILERDRTAFVSTLAPAERGFRRRQVRLFDNLGDLDLASYELEADWGALGDMARAQDRAGYRDEEAIAIPLTHERYRIARYDERLVHQDLYLTFLKIEGEWRIGGDDDLEDIGLYSARNLWDFSSVRTEESRHFLAIEPDCSRCAAGEYLVRLAEEALRDVDRYWTRPWHRHVPLIAPGSSAQLARIIQSTYPVENYLAFAVWTGGAGQNPGVRVIVNPERIATAGEDVTGILTHELTHVAALYSRGSFTPSFLDEGLAQYVGLNGEGEAISGSHGSARSRGARLPEDYEFFIGDGASVYDTYQTSLSAVAFFIERFGFRRFQRFYATLGRVTRVPGTFRYQFDRALEKTIGMGTREFERAWASSIGL
jgi:hypothetical protein